MKLAEFSAIVSEGSSLTEDQASVVADLLASAEEDPVEKADFLTKLALKGESFQEVAGLARRYRELARNPGLDEWSSRAIDVCGTGGDKQHTFNISTTVTFIVAAAGIPVLKHGNRSITSKCGSSNLLEAVGIDIGSDDAILQRSMEELGFCFMFAPAFHPAFKEIVPVRQALAEKGSDCIQYSGAVDQPGETSLPAAGSVQRDRCRYDGEGPRLSRSQSRSDRSLRFGGERWNG